MKLWLQCAQNTFMFRSFDSFIQLKDTTDFLPLRPTCTHHFSLLKTNFSSKIASLKFSRVKIVLFYEVHWFGIKSTVKWPTIKLCSVKTTYF